MTPKWHKFNAELIQKLSTASEQHPDSIRRLARQVGQVVGLDVEKLALLRSMETLAREKEVQL